MMDTLKTWLMRPLVKMQMDGKVPFAKACGVRLQSMGDGIATCTLNARPDLENAEGHLAEGAVFTLAETCSGAAMAGGFASVILGVRPVAAQVDFRVIQAARGPMLAKAHVAEAIGPLKKQLASLGKINFPVQVDVLNSEGQTVAQMRVTWNLKKK